MTQQLVKENSYKISGIPGTRVDIVRNVINLAAVHWASDWLMGTPLKTKNHPIGLFTEQEMYDVLMLLCTCVFINVLPERGFFLKDQAQIFGDKVNSLIEKSIEAAAPSTTVCDPSSYVRKEKTSNISTECLLTCCVESLELPVRSGREGVLSIPEAAR